MKNHFFKTALLGIALASLTFTPLSSLNAESPLCIQNRCTPAQIQVGPLSLPFKGNGLADYLFWDLYTLSLYAPPEAQSPKDVLQNKPKALVFNYLRKISKSQIIKGARKTLEKNNFNFKKYTPALNAINSLYQSVDDGDVYVLTYNPQAEGPEKDQEKDNGLLRLFFNTELQGEIPVSHEFAKFYFGIWLSDAPLNEDLRDGLFR